MSSTSLIVLGMHRSGTSAFTGSLKCLNVELGKKLYAGHEHINAKGYWEHSNIVDTHDIILRKLNSCWYDLNPLAENWWQSNLINTEKNKLRKFIQQDFSDTKVWGLKDPRMCRLLPMWQSLLVEINCTPFYVLIVRNPVEVAYSLERRNGFSHDRSIYLWLDHNMQAEQFTRNKQRIIFTYDQLLSNPRWVFETLESVTESIFSISVEKAWPCIESFIEKDLRHNKATEKAKGELGILANQIFELFTQSANNNTDQYHSELDHQYKKFDAYKEQLPKYLIEHINHLNTELCHYAYGKKTIILSPGN